MTISFQNIYCVGRNYGKHAAELGNSVPESPMIFMKPTHAISVLEEGILEVPGTEGDVHYETELVVRIGQTYEKGLQAETIISHYALGLDLTLRDVQTVLKEKQHPWLRAKGFRHSAPITAFTPFEGLDALLHTAFSLRINQEERQRGSLSEAIFGLQVLVDHIGQHYGLGEGDLIFTGTPAGVGKLENGDELELYWNDRSAGRGQVRLTY